ncbi:hypothetical protein [Spiroplasma endosymbiont of Colias croceus]|uniref:hypothetical protein n=1 Tax=Spiroplasma endosymbiont of Colias croceus TaxID=3066310 RepID=UPI0030CAB1E8
MIKFKWEKDKKIDTDINNNKIKISHFDNVNNSINLKKIKKSIINFQNGNELGIFINDLSNLEIEQYKIVKILKECDNCLNSMYEELMKYIEFQDELLEKSKNSFSENSNYRYNCSNDWNNVEVEKLKITHGGLNFKICNIHNHFEDILIKIHFKIKNFKEIRDLLIKK